MSDEPAKTGDTSATYVMRDPEYRGAIMKYLRAGMPGGDVHTLSEGIDSQGGFLVPQEFMTGHPIPYNAKERLRNRLLVMLGREPRPQRWQPGMLDKYPRPRSIMGDSTSEHD